MNDIKQFTNMVDMKLWLKGEFIKEGKHSIKNVCLCNNDVAERGEHDKSIITFKDVINDKTNFPKIKENIRMDIYKFFNRKMTEYANRRLRNLTSDFAIKNGEIIGAPPIIKDYTKERDELIRMSKTKASYLEKTLASINMKNILVEYKMKSEISEKLLLLSFGLTFDTLYLEALPLPKNNNIKYKRAVLLGSHFSPCDEVMLVGNAQISAPNAHLVDKETLIITESDIYIIDRTIYQNLSIRKLYENELNR